MNFLDQVSCKIYPFLPYILRLELQERLIKKADERKVKSIKETLELIDLKWPDVSNEDTLDKPIFIFSSGWRSGSTLLQRLVMSNTEVIIWGEPFACSSIIENQILSLRAINEKHPNENWFFDSFFSRSNGNKENLTQKFIANLYPDIKYLKRAQQKFFLELFSSSATDNCYRCWGIKEVRLGIDAAYYLRWLFPHAKFLFLYRNPYKSYTSLKPHLSKWSLYTRWPDVPVRTPYKFGKHWKNLVQGYLEYGEDVDGLVIKYEDLCNGAFPLSMLEEYLGFKIDGSLLEQRVGSTKKKEALTRMETLLLKKAVNPLVVELGYKP